MDPLLLAVIIGVVAFVIVRTFFKAIRLGMNLLLLAIIVVIAYLLLRSG